jgi:3-methyladenine DNA glycosylase AlkD
VQYITKKSTVIEIARHTAELWNRPGKVGAIPFLHEQLLRKKVKFPLLEAAAQVLSKAVPAGGILALADEIVQCREIGSNVLAGILLQNRLSVHFQEALDKAQAYILYGGEWYCCDIIAERVMGHALLTMPEKALPVLEKLAQHAEPWIVRAVGVGGHYAVKKGLDKANVERLFQLLLSLSNAKEEPIKTGIGWAAKTVAKFHPDLIQKYGDALQQQADIGAWFLRKIDIGLKINAKRSLR